MKETFAARSKFMLIILPFELSELCRPDLNQGNIKDSRIVAV